VRPMVFVRLSGLVELDPPTFSSSMVSPSGMDGSVENVVFRGAAGARRLHSAGGGTPSSRLPIFSCYVAPLRGA